MLYSVEVNHEHHSLNSLNMSEHVLLAAEIQQLVFCSIPLHHLLVLIPDVHTVPVSPVHPLSLVDAEGPGWHHCGGLFPVYPWKCGHRQVCRRPRVRREGGRALGSGKAWRALIDRLTFDGRSPR